jgi:hypothetical protein
MNKSILEKDMYLFKIKPSYRFHNVTSSLQMFPEASTGSDPPTGASINYWLKEKKEVEIIITNSDNDTIKTIKKDGVKGINRVWWDFKGESTDGIKEGNLSYTRCVKEDPVKKGLLYLGTENTLYLSFDDGENWQEMMSNLPHTPMYWIDIQEHFNDLILGTCV